MGENVKVIVRCRPMNQKEIAKKCDNIVETGDYVVSVLNPLARNAPRKLFRFDSVYDGISKTETIYNDMCYSLVESTLEGYNGTIFAYGQTGCGKTHTMQGDGSFADASNNNKGIIQRCFDHIFETISIASSVRYLALVSYLEIYNENIRDLLNISESITNHQLKDVPGVGVTVPSLTTQPVINAQECYSWLNLGNTNRITAATLMNEKSSRSHTIFTISLEQIQGGSGSGSGTPSDLNNTASVPLIGGIRRGKLNLVDLAGSERQSKTGTFGERLKEAAKINLSLSALGNVISALVDGKTKHVPYRDSKLTRLLQDSLGGNTKTIMISCISPADINYDETLSTLRYASRAKNISNIPKINEDPKDAQLRQYQDEILMLRKMLDESHQNESVILHKFTEDNDKQRKLWLEEEKAKMRQRMIKEINNKETQGDKKTDHKDSIYIKASNESRSDQDNIQLNARKRIDLIKQTLIGGERANDLQLRERHRLRKLEAQQHLSAIARALSRVESEDRDLLQDHYANIQQEIGIKNERIKMFNQKVKMLEREIDDLNSEFQLDRDDYLDEIRQLGRHLKFYQLLLSKARPILRKNGRNWNPEEILENSFWNDDSKTWKLPSAIENTVKLPPANLRSAFQKTLSIENKDSEDKEISSTDTDDNDLNRNESPEMYKVNILKNYFRPNRKNSDQKKRSQVYIRDFMLRKNTPLTINELQPTTLNRNATINYDFGRVENPLDKSWINATPKEIHNSSRNNGTLKLSTINGL
ncbi:osmotic avoidance abnormal protein 3 [Drosophila innubila]|uniref:osmotic avoidance abnormal protein 3 n=1 Tax=Drosophila innubila TaxID=198719 RepID=UPI00148C5A30|nr:osmotic avoidance abnormal protein 3 [Drosophila innubila]